VRGGFTRAGGALAVGLSAIWSLPAVGLVVFGVAVLVSGRESDANDGFAEFFGGSMAGVGALVLVGAVGGIVLGLRVRRGRNGARFGLAALFALFALVSGSFLASSFADTSGVDPGGVVGFGLNTAICLAVVVSALIGTRG
jgi:FtsH-binding integral membrane protein